MRRLWKAGELFLCALQGRRVDLVVSGTMTDFPATLELDPLFLQVEPPTLYLLQLQTAATARGEVAARRAVYRCDRLVEMHRLVPPNRRWGPRLARCTCRIDFFRNSTDDCFELSAKSQTKRIFPIFPPTLEQNRPTLYQISPTLEQNQPTLY